MDRKVAERAARLSKFGRSVRGLLTPGPGFAQELGLLVQIRISGRVLVRGPLLWTGGHPLEISFVAVQDRFEGEGPWCAWFGV